MQIKRRPGKSLPQDIRRVRLYEFTERQQDWDSEWDSVVGEMIEDIEDGMLGIDDFLLIPVRCPIPVALNYLQEAKDVCDANSK